MRLRFLLLASALLTAPVFPQSYNSSMTSAERARESMRYEAALLDGTYNNPMLGKSSVDMSIAYRGLGQAQRDEDAAKADAENARLERLRLQQMDREREVALAAYRQARQEEAYQKHLENERQIARAGLARWKFFDLAHNPELIARAEEVRAGRLDGVPPLELYATALALRALPPAKASSGGEPAAEYFVAKLALKALQEGQILPALLLSDDFLQDPEFLSLFALEGTEFDRIKAVYATGGHGWPADDELFLARIHNLVTDAQLASIRAARNKLMPIVGLPSIDESRNWVLQVLRYSHLNPWATQSPKLSATAQDNIVKLTKTRPVLGHFMAGLFEERMRYDPSRPSPWSGFIFERASQLSGPGFIREFARLHQEPSQSKEKTAFDIWVGRSDSNQTSPIDSLDSHSLWRVAGRLLLGHNLEGLSASLSDRRDVAAIARRLEIARDILWELTQRRDRQALTIQYLVALQEPNIDSPSLLAYLNAFHWVLGWDEPPARWRETPLIAASVLGAVPASVRGRHFPGSPGGHASGEVPPEELRSFPYAMGSGGMWYSTGYLENLPLQASIVPAVILDRERAQLEADRLQSLFRSIRPGGFGARLALVLQVEAARALKDSYLEKEALEKLSRLFSANQSANPIVDDPSELEKARELFAQAALRRTGTSLLRQPLPLSAAPDSERLLEAVALRNLAVKSFLPSIRLLPLPYSARTSGLAKDGPVRRMIAAHGLANLDGGAEVRLNLPVEDLTRWLKTGVSQETHFVGSVRPSFG